MHKHISLFLTGKAYPQTGGNQAEKLEAIS